MTTTTPLSNTPLQIPGPPLQLVGPSFGFVSPGAVGFALFYFVVFLVGVYTLVAAYHWLRYGHRSPLAIPAICVHVFVSLFLIIFAASGL